MRIFVLILTMLTVLLPGVSNSQIFTPVKWKFTSSTIDATTAEITATGTIEKKWHVYALKVSNNPDAIGPVPTTIKLDASKNYSTQGSATEGKYITHYDPNFDMDLNYYENTAVFKQKIKIYKSYQPKKIQNYPQSNHTAINNLNLQSFKQNEKYQASEFHHNQEL